MTDLLWLNGRPSPLRAFVGLIFAVMVGLWRWNSPTSGGVLYAEFITMLVVGLILSAASLVLSELLKPKPDIEDAKPSGRGDFRFPTATEGRPVPLIWGTVLMKGPNVTWWGDFRQVPVREKIKTGLWSKKRVVTGFQYFVGIDMAVCRAGGDTTVDLISIKIGDKLAPSAGVSGIDEPTFLGGDGFGSGGIVSTCTWHDGSATQSRNAYLATQQSVLSAQRGTAHYVFEGGWIGNSTRIRPWAFEVRRIPTGLFTAADAAGVAAGYTLADATIGGQDANPMEVIFEAITDTDWGMSRDASTRVDLSNFAQIANTLKDEGNGFSMQLERVTDIGEILSLVQKQIDGVLYFDRRTGLYKVRLARQDYTTNVGVSSITGSDTYNVASGGDGFTVGQTFFAEGFDNPANNGRKTVASSTATTVVVNETLVNETPSGSIFGGARISELLGLSLIEQPGHSNIIEVKEFSRQTWEGTSNQVRIGFTDRSRDYFDTFARSDSLSNQRNQNGEIVTSSINFPGVKDRTTANAIAARELKLLAFPLAKTTLVTNREPWDVNPGDPIRFTCQKLGLIDLVIRAARVDFGDLGGRMTIGAIQDIFALETGFFGDPPDPLWELPTQGVSTIPADEQLVFEAPKAIVDRDILFPAAPDRVFVGARAQAGETAIKIYQRNDTVAPSGDYELDGQNEGLFLIGTLNVALDAGDANPTGTIQIDSTPDSKSRIELSFDPDGATATEIGQELANVIYIGGEFIGVSDIADAGGNLLNFTDCYRGLMDSVPKDHDVGADVYLLYVSGGLNDSTIPPGNVVDVQPRTVSRDAELSEGDSTTVQLTMDNRYRRPYPPYRFDVNSSRFPSAPSLDQGITNPGGDAVGLDIDWYRRDFDRGDITVGGVTTTDEVVSLSDDGETVEAGFQAKHDHESQLTVSVIDGDGLTIQAYQSAWMNGRTDVVSRADILAWLDGSLPSTDQVVLSVLTRHTLDAVVREAREPLVFDCTPASSSLTGLVNLGTVFANGPVSRTYTVASATVHSFTHGTSLTGVEFRLNNGAWTAIGSFPAGALSVSDELEFRHGDTSGTPANSVAVLDDGTDDVAYVVFNTESEYEGLVGYWNLNESSDGSSAVARASRFGGAPEFTDNNTCASEAGQFSNAVTCTEGSSDATVEHLSISNADALRKNLMPSGTEEFTIMCWAKLPSGGAVAKSTQMVWTLADFDSGSPFSNRSVYLFYNDPAGGGWNFVFIENDGTIHSGLVTFGGTNNVNDEDKWINLSMVVSSAAGGTLTVYAKDGLTTPTPSYTNQTGLGTVQTTDQPLAIGAGYHSGATEQTFSPVEIAVDEMRIYKRALSESEIDDIVAAQQPLS